ncbi:MAG TPA: ScpA family protein [Dehalococcoidia bacterium]
MNRPAPTVEAFELQTPVFSGPLDLLLHLIERQDLDITAVSLVQVTDQYLGYLRAGEQIDANALADFVAIGARLLELKSRALLPRPPAAEPDEDEEDAGEELAQLLREYKRFREAAEALREREQAGLRSYPRLAPPPDLPPAAGLEGVTLEALARLFQEVLLRQPDPEPAVEVRRDTVTIKERMSALLDALRRFGKVSFLGLVRAARSRVEVVVAFLALLELLKAGQVHAEQEDLFGDILVTPARAEPA